MNIPQPNDRDLAGNQAASLTEDLGKLCENWKYGCNGVTDGPENGKLVLCDSCQEAI